MQDKIQMKLIKTVAILGIYSALNDISNET